MTLPPATPLATAAEPVAPPLTAVASPAVEIETVISGLHQPWAVAFFPEGSLLITERSWRLVHFHPATGHTNEVTGLPAGAG